MNYPEEPHWSTKPYWDYLNKKRAAALTRLVRAMMYNDGKEQYEIEVTLGKRQRREVEDQSHQWWSHEEKRAQVAYNEAVSKQVDFRRNEINNQPPQ